MVWEVFCPIRRIGARRSFQKVMLGASISYTGGNNTTLNHLLSEYAPFGLFNYFDFWTSNLDYEAERRKVRSPPIKRKAALACETAHQIGLYLRRLMPAFDTLQPSLVGKGDEGTLIQPTA